MRVTYSDRARQWGEGFSLLRQATSRLEEVLGPSADQVEAEWDRTEDSSDGPLYTLKLRDATGEARASFPLVGLKIPDYVHTRLYGLWGDLLAERFNEQHRKVEKLVAELGVD